MRSLKYRCVLLKHTRMGNQTKSSQVKSNRVKSNQVKWNTIKSSQMLKQNKLNQTKSNPRHYTGESATCNGELPTYTEESPTAIGESSTENCNLRGIHGMDTAESRVLLRINTSYTGESANKTEEFANKTGESTVSGESTYMCSGFRSTLFWKTF